MINTILSIKIDYHSFKIWIKKPLNKYSNHLNISNLLITQGLHLNKIIITVRVSKEHHLHLRQMIWIFMNLWEYLYVKKIRAIKQWLKYKCRKYSHQWLIEGRKKNLLGVMKIVCLINNHSERVHLLLWVMKLVFQE